MTVAVTVGSASDLAGLPAEGPLVVEVLGDPSSPELAAGVVEALRGRADVTVASFDWYALRLAAAAGLRTAFATPAGVALDAAVAYAVEAGHPEVCPHVSAVLESPSSVAEARAAGVSVVCWDVPDDLVARVLELGCDGAVYTTTDSASGTLRNVTFSTSPR